MTTRHHTFPCPHPDQHHLHTVGRPTGPKVQPVRLDTKRNVYRDTYVGGPDSGLKANQVWESYSRETFVNAKGRTVSVWKFERLDDVGTPWQAVYMPTGQRRAGFGSRRAAQVAAADGSLLAGFAAEDAAAMAKPCPGRCGRPAAALVNTVDGPAPVCAGHRPEAEARGYTTRTPVNIEATA